MASIAEHVAGCLEAFRSVSIIIPGEAQDYSKKATWKIRDEFSRFKVWSGNIGAHQHGRSSLDYRLRDASHLTTQVKNLLSDLKNLLDTACLILEGKKAPWEQDIPDEEDDDLSGVEEDDIGFSTELDQISADVVEVINCLLNLSVSIQSPAPHDRFRGSSETDTSFYEPADIAHVKSKYELADPRLIEQLGKANSRRRQYFKYRQSHHQKLSQGIDKDHDSAERQSTVASSIPSAMKTNMSDFADIVNTDELSDSGFTQTSYASSKETPDRPRFPALPAAAANGPFECPFCFMMINVSTSYAWRKHVYADLRPYSCVAINCPISGTEFGRRRQWIEHMIQNHWRDWYCCFCAHEHFTSALSFQAHIKSAHAEVASRSEIESITSLCERPRPFNRNTSCPMCRCYLSSVKVYRNHVGRHLEDTALFILPKVYEYEKMPGEEVSISGIEHDFSHVGSDHSYQGKVSNLQEREENYGELDWSDTQEYIGKEEEFSNDAEQKTRYLIKGLDDIRKELGDIRENHDLNDHKRDVTADNNIWRQKYSMLHELSVILQNTSISSQEFRQNSPHGIGATEWERLQDENAKLENLINRGNSIIKDLLEFNRRSVDIIDEASKNLTNRIDDDSLYKQELKKLQEYSHILRGIKERSMGVQAQQLWRQNEFITNLPEVSATPLPLHSRRSSCSVESVDSIVRAQSNDPIEKYEEEREGDDTHRLKKHPIISDLDEEEFNEIVASKKTDIDERPTYTRMSRRHLSLETLRAYNIDYQLDLDPEYILIKRWVPESEQDTLWGHTRLIRGQRDQRLHVRKEKNQKGMKDQQGATTEPEFEWVRKKERRRSRSPGLLMYLAGARPADFDDPDHH